MFSSTAEFFEIVESCSRLEGIESKTSINALNLTAKLLKLLQWLRGRIMKFNQGKIVRTDTNIKSL